MKKLLVLLFYNTSLPWNALHSKSTQYFHIKKKLAITFSKGMRALYIIFDPLLTTAM